MVGVVGSGSTVWLTIAARGWLADDPAAAAAAAATTAAEPTPALFGALTNMLPGGGAAPADARPSLETTRGGWVVALGGAVYELGVPSSAQATATAAAAAAATSATPGPLAQLSQISLVSNLATLVVVAAG